MLALASRTNRRRVVEQELARVGVEYHDWDPLHVRLTVLDSRAKIRAAIKYSILDPQAEEGVAALYDSSRRTRNRISVMQATLPGGAANYFRHMGDVVGDADYVVVTGEFRCDDLAGGTTLHGLAYLTTAITGTPYWVVWVDSGGNVIAGNYKSGAPQATATTGAVYAQGGLAKFEATFARDGSYRSIKVTTSAGTTFASNSTAADDLTGVGFVDFMVGSWAAFHHTQGSVAEVSVYRLDASLDLATSARLHAGCLPTDKNLTQPAHHWPLSGNGSDVIGGATLSTQGTATFTGGDEVGVLRSQVRPKAGRMLGNGAGYASVAADLSNGNVFTIGCRFYLPSTPAATRGLFGVGDTNSQSLHWVGINNSGLLFSEAWAGGSADSGVGTTPTLGQVNTAVLVVNGATSRSLYVNGVLIGEDTSSIAPTGLDTTSFGNVFLNGPQGLVLGAGEWISLGFTCSEALTAEEVAAWHEVQDIRLVSANVTLLADFAHTTGTVVPDLSGSGNALTLSGSPGTTRSGGGHLAYAHAFNFTQKVTSEGSTEGTRYLNFDGTGELVVPRCVVSRDPFEIGCSFKAGLQSTYGVLVVIREGNTGSDRAYHYVVDSGGSLNAALFSSDNTSGTSQASSPTTATLNDWHVFQSRCEAANARYVTLDGVDGSLVASNVQHDDFTQLTIGSAALGGAEAFTGQVQRVVVTYKLRSLARRKRDQKWLARVAAP